MEILRKVNWHAVSLSLALGILGLHLWATSGATRKPLLRVKHHALESQSSHGSMWTGTTEPALFTNTTATSTKAGQWARCVHKKAHRSRHAYCACGCFAYRAGFAAHRGGLFATKGHRCTGGILWQEQVVQIPRNWLPDSYRLGYLFGDVIGDLPASGSYNPSLVELPNEVRTRLHPQAHYLSTARHTETRCKKCRQPRWQRKRFKTTNIWNDNAHCQGSNSSGESSAARNRIPQTLLVMDVNFTTLLVIDSPKGGLYDIRLMKLSDGTILLSGSQLHTREFEVWQLHFRTKQQDSHSSCPSEVAIELSAFYESGVTHTRPLGKNIGLFQTRGELQVLWRFGNPMEVWRWVDGRGHNGSEEDSRNVSFRVRGNGHPVLLPHENAYLAIVHIKHGLDISPTMKYLHRFVVLESQPPYRWLRASPFFCLPALSLWPDRGEGFKTWSMQERSAELAWSSCDTVQFLMSMVIVGNELLVTFGAGDCQPGIARFPLDEVLGNTSRNWRDNVPDGFVPRD